MPETPKQSPKFKVGDKVMLPVTQWNTELGEGAKNLIEEAKSRNQDYLYVSLITDNLPDEAKPEVKYGYWLSLYPKKGEGTTLLFYENELTAYDEDEAVPNVTAGKLFFDEPPHDDNNTYLKTKSGYIQKIINTENFEWIQPFKTNEMLFQWRETQKSLISGVALKIQLFYKEGITIKYEDGSGEAVLSDGMITTPDVFVEKMTEISTILRQDGNNDYANEVTTIQLALTDRIWGAKTIDCSFVDNTPEAVPETPFQQIDFLSPSTEELDILIKGMQYYSDGLTFINSVFANAKINLKSRVAYIEVLFDKVNNIIKLSEPSKNIRVWSTEIQQRISDESIAEITELYIQTLTKLIEYAEKDTPKDCEADESKIVSNQVKKFYDLNKTRIDKLNPKFSCLIVKALVSLSDYESCGKPSSESLPKSKPDILSDIKNFKI